MEEVTEFPLGSGLQLCRSSTHQCSITGSGRFFFIKRPSNTNHNVMLQCAHVRGMRLKGIPSCDNTCVFIECRTLSVIKRRGLGALIAVKKHGANEYKLGLCIATDLYSMAYLEWNGPYHALDNLYGVRKKTTEWNSISTYLSNEIITLRWKNTTSRTTTKAPKPCIDMPEIHFIGNPKKLFIQYKNRYN